MAEGIDIDNPDFIRPDGSHVFVDYQDFSGDGLDAPTSGGEAFLDASAIASQGKTYDISHFGAVPLAAPCRVRVEGVAPGASLVGHQDIRPERILDHLGHPPGYRLRRDRRPRERPQRVVRLQPVPHGPGAGHRGGIQRRRRGRRHHGHRRRRRRRAGRHLGSPDTDPNIINVGASNNFRYYAETGTDGYVPPFATKGWISDNISGLSSGGFAESGPTDDLIAPGDTSFAACTPDVAKCTPTAPIWRASPRRSSSPAAPASRRP